MLRRALLLLALLPLAAASQPLEPLEGRFETSGVPAVGEPLTLRIHYRANVDVDQTYALHVPPFVEVSPAPSWRVDLAKGEESVHALTLTPTRAAYWSAAVTQGEAPPRGYVLHVRTDADGGAATTGHDASEVIPPREAVLGLTARAVNATAYEAEFFAAKSGLWRVDESIAVSLDAKPPSVAEGPRVDARVQEDIGPNTYAFRALRAFVVARFERPDVEPPLPDPSRLAKCEDFGFRTEAGTFRYESRGVEDCAGLASAMRPTPSPAVAPAFALVLALAWAWRRR